MSASTFRLRGTADDHRDRGMLYGQSHRTLNSDWKTEIEALDNAEDFMKRQPPRGCNAKIWVEESHADGSFRVVAKWRGEWVPGHANVWRPA